MSARNHRFSPVALVAALALVAGCDGGGGAEVTKAGPGPRPIAVTVAEVERRPVERTVEVVGTLRGWEEVTIGAKRAGRVIKVGHDMGDRVKPGEVLVELETVDARLAAQQAESKYLAELVKLGLRRGQAEEYFEKYGVNEQILLGEVVDTLIKGVAAIRQMEASRDKATLNLNRQRQINQRGAGTVMDLQNSENDARMADAAYDDAITQARAVVANAVSSRVALDQANQALEDLTIRTPFPSTLPEGATADEPPVYALTKRSVSEGQMLRDGDAVATLVIESPLRLWTNVPERFAADVAVGQPMRIAVASYPGEAFAGTVSRINPSVDPVSRTFQVEATVMNDDGRLRPGGFAKASILTRRDDNATVVPLESIVRFAGVTKLFVVEGTKAREVRVDTGLEFGGKVEVTGDLPADAPVVTSGQTQLADGTPVTIRTPAPAETEATPAPAPVATPPAAAGAATGG